MRKVVRKECCNSGTPNPSSGSKSVPTSPQGIPKIVDMSAKPEQPAPVHLALIRRILLELCPLYFRQEFCQDADHVQRCADDERTLREVLAINRSGSLRTHEEQGVDAVEDCVEGSDHRSRGNAKLFLSDE